MPDNTPEMIDAAGASRLPMTQEIAVQLGKTQMAKIIGVEHNEACIIQHGRRAFRKGEPARIVEFSHYDPKAEKGTPPHPCWVLRYEDGCGPIYIRMDLPCYALDKAPTWASIGLAPALWLEMVPANCVRRSLKVKGRD